MNVALLYFDDCPNWRLADERLTQALASTGYADAVVEYIQVTTEERAIELGFVGSPTILLEGRDPFADPHSGVGLSCRLYATPDGLAGSPTLQQIADALTSVR